MVGRRCSELLSPDTSAHLPEKDVKNSLIEDFYQRVMGKARKVIGQPAKPAARRVGWVVRQP